MNPMVHGGVSLLKSSEVNLAKGFRVSMDRTVRTDGIIPVTNPRTTPTATLLLERQSVEQRLEEEGGIGDSVEVTERSSRISRYPVSRSHDSKASSGTLKDRGFPLNNAILSLSLSRSLSFFVFSLRKI